MNSTSMRQDLHDFAVELRRLAYTMPGGCEDPLIRLSERMALTADHEASGATSTAARAPEKTAAAAAT